MDRAETLVREQQLKVSGLAPGSAEPRSGIGSGSVAHDVVSRLFTLV